MARSDMKGDIVLRLVDGRSERRELVLEGGKSIPPLALGTHGAWSVEAPHVARVHVVVAFNGKTVFVGLHGGEKALLDGFPLGERWTEVRLPAELRFGGARLTIGRRAGPDEETQVPGEEATSHGGARRGEANGPRLRRDDEVTCFDEVRLQEALRLTRDDEVTCIGAVEVPAEARRPELDTAVPLPRAMPKVARAMLRPAIRPVGHTMRMGAPPLPGAPILPPVVAPATRSSLPSAPPAPASEVEDDAVIGRTSSMPPTQPNDGLRPAAFPSFDRPLPVAVARPSQPTIATPQRTPEPTPDDSTGHHFTHSFDSVVARVLAVSGEHPSETPPERPLAPARTKLDALKNGWRQASLPKRAIALLLAPAIVGAVFTMRATPVARSRPVPLETSAPVVVASEATAAPSATPPDGALPRFAQGATAGAGGAEPAVTARTTVNPRLSNAGLRDTRSAERRALDTAASGQDVLAAEQYEALAAEHPDNVAFPEAARILRARSAAHPPRAVR